MSEYIYLYDSTLRDGSQAEGIDFTATDKCDLAIALDNLGVDYIEAGWVGANPTDDSFFANPPKLKTSKFTAFGMTRRPNKKIDQDPGIEALIKSNLKDVCIVGKSWDFHVTKALNTTLEENISMVHDTISFLSEKKLNVMFDAEHFFDGYKNNKEFSLSVIKEAYNSGAQWIILCDTNGGTLPFEIEEIIKDVIKYIPGKNLGIHCHNDTGNAIANSIVAAKVGVRQIQGTINGLGERCGNANLISLIPTLMLKMGFKTSVSLESLKNLKKLSSLLNEKTNRLTDNFAPYIGSSAFSHKGGIHVSAISKDSKSYEHINPELVGNKRNILISSQSGRSNIITKLKETGFNLEDFTEQDIKALVDKVKLQESNGYSYDISGASFELLVQRYLNKVPVYFVTESFRALDEYKYNKKSSSNISEVITKIFIKDKLIMNVAEGNGPVDALSNSLYKTLRNDYPAVDKINLLDYKVRIVNPSNGTQAITRVLIESQNKETKENWFTVGVSSNILIASYEALSDSIIFAFMKENIS